MPVPAQDAAQLQDEPGHDNDTTTTPKFLGDLARQPVTPEIQPTICVMMGWQARDRIEVGRELRTVPGHSAFWSS